MISTPEKRRARKRDKLKEKSRSIACPTASLGNSTGSSKARLAFRVVPN